MRYLTGSLEVPRKRSFSRGPCHLGGGSFLTATPDAAISPLRERSSASKQAERARAKRRPEVVTEGELLPTEIWEHIFRAAAPALLCVLRAGCRTWRTQLDEAECLWETAYRAEWCAGQALLAVESAPFWRNQFLARWWAHSRWGCKPPTVFTVMGKSSHGGTVTCVTLGECGLDSGEGTALSASDDGSVFQWRFSRAMGAQSPNANHAVAQQHHRQCRGGDVRCPQRVKQYYGQHGPVWCLWHDPGQDLLLSGGSDATVKLWSLSGERCVATLRGHASWVTALDALQSGRVVVSGGSDGILKFWHLESRQCMSSHGPPENNPRHSTNCLAVVEARSALLSGHSSLQHLLHWDLATMRCLGRFAGHDDDVYAIHAEGPTAVISGSKDRSLRIWDPRSPADRSCVGIFRGHTGAVLDVKLRGNRAVSASMDKTVRMWDVRSPQSPLATLEGHSAEVHCVDFRDRMVLSGSRDTSLKVWSVV